MRGSRQTRFGAFLTMLSCLVLTGVALIGGASAANAAPYGTNTVGVTVSVTVNSAGPVTLNVTLFDGLANTMYTVVLHSNPVTLGTLTADASGNASGSFAAPAGFSGAHEVIVTANGTTASSGSTEIMLPASCVNGINGTTPLTFTPSPPVAGESLTVSGSGFTAGELVDVTITGNNASSVDLGSAHAGPSGTFSLAFTLPQSTSGTVTLTATGLTSAVTRAALLGFCNGTGLASTGRPPAGFFSRTSTQYGIAALLALAAAALLVSDRRRRVVAARG